MPDKRYYGFVQMSECYHSSPNCPVLVRMAKKRNIEVQEFDTEGAAHKRGHLRRCRLCLGKNVYRLGGDDPVRISDTQLAALNYMVGIYNRTGSMTLQQIAAKRNRSIVATYLIVRTLRRMGLVTHRHVAGMQKAKMATLAPTEKGIRISKADPAEDLRVPA